MEIVGNVGVDTIYSVPNGIKGIGSVAERLLANNFNPAALRTNGLLRYDDWKEIDRTVVKAAQERINGTREFLSRGLTYNIPNGMSVMSLAYETQSDIAAAEISMNAGVQATRDRPDYDITYLPLPIVHTNMKFDIRDLGASRRNGMPLDTSGAELATAKVMQKVEEIVFTGGDNLAFKGGIIYGLEDYPSANTGSLTEDWTASAASGATIIADIVAMKQALVNDKMHGPYGLFIPTAYTEVLDQDYASNYPRTIRDRIMALEGISFIRTVDMMTAGKVILCQLTSDVMRIVVGQPITTVEWDSPDGMSKYLKVLTIMVPQPRSTYEGDCGIAVYSA